MLRYLVIISLLFCITPAHAEDTYFEEARIALIDGNKQQKIKVQIAKTREQLKEGLMWRETLAPYAGMLFDFGANYPLVMWMKNTLISLDMVFYNEEKKVVHIAKRTTPHSLARIATPREARYVLEIPAGMADAYQIRLDNRFNYVQE